MNANANDVAAATLLMLEAKKNASLETLMLKESFNDKKDSIYGEYIKDGIIVAQCAYFHNADHFVVSVNGDHFIYDKPEDDAYLIKRIMLRIRDHL